MATKQKHMERSHRSHRNYKPFAHFAARSATVEAVKKELRRKNSRPLLERIKARFQRRKTADK